MKKPFPGSLLLFPFKSICIQALSSGIIVLALVAQNWLKKMILAATLLLLVTRAADPAAAMERQSTSPGCFRHRTLSTDRLVRGQPARCLGAAPGRACATARRCSLPDHRALVQYVGAVQKSRRMYDRLIDLLNTMIRDKRLAARSAGHHRLPAHAGRGAAARPCLSRFHLPHEAEAGLQNALMNFWFRHDWELIWPLYAVVFSFSRTCRASPRAALLLFQLLFSLPHIAMGRVVSFLYFRRHGVRWSSRSEQRPSRHAARLLRRHLAYLAVILLFFVKAPPLLPLPLHWALLLVAAVYIEPREEGRREWRLGPSSSGKRTPCAAAWLSPR